MKAKYKGVCGLCFCRFKKGDEIEKTPRQLMGPVGLPWSHKRCADYINRVLAPETQSEVKSKILQHAQKPEQGD